MLLHLYSKHQQVSQQLNHGMQMVANSTAACTGMAEPLHCTRKTGKRLVKHHHSAGDSTVSRLFG